MTGIPWHDLSWTRDENGNLFPLYRDAALAAGWTPPSVDPFEMDPDQ